MNKVDTFKDFKTLKKHFSNLKFTNIITKRFFENSEKERRKISEVRYMTQLTISLRPPTSSNGKLP